MNIVGRSAGRYAKGAVVYRQAAIADGVYYLQEGRIKISVASRQGRDAIIGILEAGAFFGEGCLIGHDERAASAVAMVDSKVMRIAKAEMLRLLREEPAFTEVFINHLLSRNRRIEADLVDQLFNTSEKRLARALLLLANVQGGGMPQPVATKVSQETLAELIGTTRPRVSHLMTKFRKLGFISGGTGNLQVHSSLFSVVLREAPETKESTATIPGKEATTIRRHEQPPRHAEDRRAGRRLGIRPKASDCRTARIRSKVVESDSTNCAVAVPRGSLLIAPPD